MKGIKDMELEEVKAHNRSLKKKKIPEEKILITVYHYTFNLPLAEQIKMLKAGFLTRDEFMGLEPYGLDYKAITINLNWHFWIAQRH